VRFRGVDHGCLFEDVEGGQCGVHGQHCRGAQQADSRDGGIDQRADAEADNGAFGLPAGDGLTAMPDIDAPYSNTAGASGALGQIVGRCRGGGGNCRDKQQQQRLSNISTRSTAEAGLNTAWWLTQMTPMTKKLTA
jgi:hypothetical protein